MDTIFLDREYSVSAIIITHNRVALLEKALNSVINQTYADIEIIVVDDASNDGTRDYVSQFLGKVVYVRIDQNESRGANYARNVGVRIAKGNYVAFLDDDDEWLPDKLELQIGLLRDNKDIAIVGCGRIEEFNYSRRLCANTKKLLEGDLKEKVLYTIPYVTSTLLIKKKELESIGLFDENLMYWQDYEMEIRLLQKCKIGVVRKHLIVYRIVFDDKERKTNNIDNWEKAVDYVNEKHKKLLESQSQEILRLRKIMIAKDGAQRSENSGNKSLLKVYLKDLLKIDRSIKNLIRVWLNIYSFKRLFVEALLKFY